MTLKQAKDGQVSSQSAVQRCRCGLGSFPNRHRGLSTDPYPQKHQAVPRGCPALGSCGVSPGLDPLRIHLHMPVLKGNLL